MTLARRWASYTEVNGHEKQSSPDGIPGHRSVNKASKVRGLQLWADLEREMGFVY